MWIEVKRVSGQMIAEMWKELFEGEGVPTRLLPENLEEGERATYRVMVPKDRDHVIAEILRKL